MTEVKPLSPPGGAVAPPTVMRPNAARQQFPRHVVGRRGWLMRRLLLVADVVGLSVAFTATQVLFHGEWPALHAIGLYLVAVPVFVVGAKLFGLYDRDEERADNTTIDDFARVFLLATTGTFLVAQGLALLSEYVPNGTTISFFWLILIVSVVTARVGARTLARRSSAYLQRTIVVGAGDVGQLVARRLLQHREYGLDLLGLVDSCPKERRPDLGDLTILGELHELPEIARQYRVDRVIFAFSADPHEELVPHVRTLRDRGVLVDIVPRLFDVIGPKLHVHAVEGAPLVGLAPVRIPRSSRGLKRALDIGVAGTALLACAPVLALAALLVRLDSPGPVLFRQRRLGKDMREFTLLKFRTMFPDTDQASHRAYIAATMSSDAVVGSNGLYKLDRGNELTRVGRWLRRTSLDELPQLWNILKGDMSIVGPRPCLRYELEHFAPHHFDRFLVPAGLTGLWQVSARAHSTFGEALDLDVLYAHSWSLGLDISLLFRTPLQLFRSATA